jgi:general secretion pathway protein C
MVVVNWKKGLELAANPGPRLVAGVQVALVLALAYSLAQVSWRFMPPAGEDAQPVPGLVLPKPVASQAAASAGQQIPQWHLFGEATVDALAAVPDELPETSLQLTLHGVIASPDPALARAIVADPAGKDNFYKIGDTLPGNVTLKEIHGDRIVIQRGSRYETLTLPKASLNTSSSAPTPQMGSGAPKTSYTLREYRNALLNNPNEVADLVRITPKNEGGRFLGYQLQPGRDAQFMARYGLMPGDVVTAVNGVVLDSPIKGMQMMKELAKVDTLDLEIDRNGIRQRFTLPIN